MKGGFNKMFRNFAAMKGNSPLDKVRDFNFSELLKQLMDMITKNRRKNTFDVSKISLRSDGLSQRRSSWRLCKSNFAQNCAEIHQWPTELGGQYQVSDHHPQVSSGQRSLAGDCEWIKTQIPHFDTIPNEERWGGQLFTKNCCFTFKTVLWLFTGTY